MRGAVRALALFAILLAIVAVRVVWSSRGEWRAAASASGDDELMHLGRAARLYAPGSPYSRRALDKLAAIGRDDPTRALAAWREVRSAILATRSFYTPHRALLAGRAHERAQAERVHLRPGRVARPAGIPPCRGVHRALKPSG